MTKIKKLLISSFFAICPIAQQVSAYTVHIIDNILYSTSVYYTVGEEPRKVVPLGRSVLIDVEVGQTVRIEHEDASTTVDHGCTVTLYKNEEMNQIIIETRYNDQIE